MHGNSKLLYLDIRTVNACTPQFEDTYSSVFIEICMQFSRQQGEMKATNHHKYVQEADKLQMHQSDLKPYPKVEQ
jgi:hypothetical protein